MTYEERQQYRELKDRIEGLRERLTEGAPGRPVSREEAAALLDLVDVAVERMSPERWDRAMDAIAEEAARRAGAMAAARGS